MLNRDALKLRLAVARWSAKDMIGEWKKVAEEGVAISGGKVESGHYIPEENPDVLVKNIMDFFVGNQNKI